MEGIVCGPGGRYNTMPDERVDVADYLDMIRIYLLTILEICEVAERLAKRIGTHSRLLPSRYQAPMPSSRLPPRQSPLPGSGTRRITPVIAAGATASDASTEEH